MNEQLIIKKIWYPPLNMYIFSEVRVPIIRPEIKEDYPTIVCESEPLEIQIREQEWEEQSPVLMCRDYVKFVDEEEEESEESIFHDYFRLLMEQQDFIDMYASLNQDSGSEDDETVKDFFKHHQLPDICSNRYLMREIYDMTYCSEEDVEIYTDELIEGEPDVERVYRGLDVIREDKKELAQTTIKLQFECLDEQEVVVEQLCSPYIPPSNVVYNLESKLNCETRNGGYQLAKLIHLDENPEVAHEIYRIPIKGLDTVCLSIPSTLSCRIKFKAGGRYFDVRQEAVRYFYVEGLDILRLKYDICLGRKAVKLKRYSEDYMIDVLVCNETRYVEVDLRYESRRNYEQLIDLIGPPLIEEHIELDATEIKGSNWIWCRRKDKKCDCRIRSLMMSEKACHNRKKNKLS